MRLLLFLLSGAYRPHPSVRSGPILLGSRQPCRFLALHAAVYNLFNVQRHLISIHPLLQIQTAAFDQSRQVTATV